MAATHNFTLDQGADYALGFTFKDDAGQVVPLAGTSLALQARRSYGAPATVFNLSTANGGITYDGNTAVCVFSKAATTAVGFSGDADELELVYDAELTFADGGVQRVVQGAITLTREVTR